MIPPLPDTLAEVARQMLAGRHHDVALSEFLDGFYEDEASRAARLAEEPPRTGDVLRDAYLGAVGEHLARRWRVAIPGWALRDDRMAPEPWFLGGPRLAGLFLVESPLAFRRRRIFTEREPLRRARMPRPG